MLRRRARGPLLVPHALQRDLPDAPTPRGRRGRGHPAGHHRRHLPLRRRRPRRRGTATSGPRCASRARCGASRWRRSSCWPSVRRGAPTPGPSPRGPACAPTPSRPSAGTASTPRTPPRTAHITAALGNGPDPVVAITDYMRSVPDQVSRFVERPYTSLGHRRLRPLRRPGRAALVLRGGRRPSGGRRAPAAGASRDASTPATVSAAIAELGIDPDRIAPFTV